MNVLILDLGIFFYMHGTQIAIFFLMPQVGFVCKSSINQLRKTIFKTSVPIFFTCFFYSCTVLPNFMKTISPPRNTFPDQESQILGGNTGLPNSLPGDLGCSLDQVPQVLKGGDPKASHTLFNLTTCQRRAMTILAESSSVPADERRMDVANSMIKTQFKYVKIRPGKIKITVNEFDGKTWNPVENIDKKNMILSKALISIKSDFVYIPVHQETTTYHPLLQHLLDEGEAFGVLPPHLPEVSQSTATIATMSRSQWAVPKNSDSLYTIKVGSDTVNRKLQPHKLTDVYADLNDLQVISQKTSIAPLVRSHGVLYMPDRYSVMIEYLGSKFKSPPPYGIAIRDYESILRDQDRLYISYHRLSRTKLDSRGKVNVPVHWDRTFEYSNDHFKRILEQLNDGMAKVVAIHNANGYLTRDFHGQNILVGLPLSPFIKAKLLIRDVTDIYDTNFDHKISCYPCLAQIKADHWPANTKQSIDEIYNLAYSAMMLKLKFMSTSIPWGNITRDSSLVTVWTALIERQQLGYWQEVSRIRQSASCLP
jgi:ribosomal protein S19